MSRVPGPGLGNENPVVEVQGLEGGSKPDHDLSSPVTGGCGRQSQTMFNRFNNADAAASVS